MTTTRVLTACAACTLVATFTTSTAGQIGTPATSGPQTIRAPFTVVDGKGQPLMKVDTDPTSGYARVVVGRGASRVEIISRPDDSAVQVFHEKRALTVAADAAGARLQAWNSQAVNVVKLQSSLNEVGYLSLSNGTGQINVDAGTDTAGNVGTVRTWGPGGGGTSAVPGLPPSYIVGRR